MKLPKIISIKEANYKGYKYKVGRDNIGWWSLAKTKWEAIKLWFWHL